MKNDSIKKYIIPNIPYLFVLWAFLKLGTAYRLAAGADFAHKLMGLGQTIGPAFADFAPGLAPFDWLVGIVGAVAFRVMVYVKSKNAKKFRRDEEYGSARWGCPKDIAPFVDHLYTERRLSYPEHRYPQDQAHRTLRQTSQGVFRNAPPDTVQ